MNREDEPRSVDDVDDFLVTPATSIDGSRTSGRISMLPARDSEDDSRPQRLRLVGKGGHGEVWLVRYLGSEEVWKYIPLATSEEARALREALHSRRVDHPNVVRVFDVFRQDENYVLRMEYVPGRDLFRVVREDGILDAREVVRVGLQVADALAAAHSENIVHLDLKPQNLILRDDGQVMLTDFGISASVLQETTDGVGRGTPFFMSPEQIDGRSRLDPAIDVWAFGVTLYFLVTGEYPFAFDDRDYREVILNDEPIPIAVREPVLDDELWTTIAHCLRKNASDRFASIDEVRVELLAIRDGVTCPRCAQRRARTELGSPCTACGTAIDPALQRLLEVFQDGQSRFSGADFRGAERCFLEVLQEADACMSTLRDRASRCAEASRDAADELAEVLRTVRDAVQRDRYLEAYRRARACPARSSRSRDRKGLESEILIEIRKRCTGVRAQVEKLVREANFDEARRKLEEVEGFLSHPPLRALLLEEGQGLIEDYSGSTSEIYRTITEREEIRRRHREAAEAALQALDFETAKKELGTLYHWFHAKEHLERIRELNRAAESLDIVRRNALDHLDALWETRRIPDGVTLELDAAHRHCKELVEAFPPEHYPKVQEFEVCRARLDELLPELRRVARASLAQARLAEISGNVVDAMHELRDTSAYLLRTDLFSSDEQEEARRILRNARERTQKADARETEGFRALESRRYAQAIAAFEEASLLDPRRAQEWTSALLEARDSSAVALRLADEVHPLYFSLIQRPPRIDDLIAYLWKIAKLLPLQDEAAAEESRVRTVEVFARGLHSVSSKIVVEGRLETAFSLFEELEPVVRAASEAGLLPVLLEAHEVRESVNQVIRKLIDVVAGDGEAPFEMRCHRYAQVLDLLEGWQDFLRNFHKRPSSRDRGALWHPIQNVLVALRDEADRGKRMGREGLQPLMLLQACVQRAVDLVPSEHRDLAERVQSHIRLRSQTLRLRGMVRSSLRFAVAVGVPVMLVVMAVTVVLMTNERDEREARIQSLRNLLAESIPPDSPDSSHKSWPVHRLGLERLIDAPRERAALLTFLEDDVPGWNVLHRSWQAASPLERSAALDRLLDGTRSLLMKLDRLRERGVLNGRYAEPKAQGWIASVNEALTAREDSSAAFAESTLVLDASVAATDQDLERRLRRSDELLERRTRAIEGWVETLRARFAGQPAAIATQLGELETLTAAIEARRRVDSENQRTLWTFLRSIDVAADHRAVDVPGERDLHPWVEAGAGGIMGRAHAWEGHVFEEYLDARALLVRGDGRLDAARDAYWVTLVDRSVLMHQIDAFRRLFERSIDAIEPSVGESDLHRRLGLLSRTADAIRSEGASIVIEVPGLEPSLRAWLTNVVAGDARGAAEK